MRRSTPLAFAFVAPALLLLAAILGWPLISAVILGFQNIGAVGTGGELTGLDNYKKVLSDGVFWRAGTTSLIWVLANAVVQTILALVTALALQRNFPGVRIARTWVILTWIAPTVVTVIVWRWLFSSSGGMINPLLMQLGVTEKPIGFFNTPTTAMATLIFINS